MAYVNISMETSHWTFVDFIEEVIYLSEIEEVPGIADRRSDLLQEVWRRFPDECKDLGMTVAPSTEAVLLCDALGCFR